MTSAEEVELRITFEAMMEGMRADQTASAGATLLAKDATGKFVGMISIITSELMAEVLLNQIYAIPGVGHEQRAVPLRPEKPAPSIFKRGGEA